MGQNVSPFAGIEETLPLLLTAVADKKLTLADIQIRLRNNPFSIFGLPEQMNTQVHAIVERATLLKKREGYWSLLDSTKAIGYVHRVVFHCQTVVLDGNLTSNVFGKHISSSYFSFSKVMYTT